MKNKLIYGLLICSALFGCTDDETPSPSYEDKDWYEITYDPNANEIDQLRYEIYKETDIPIFYNDTLGSEVRYDGGGNQYTYYNVFKIGYTFINPNSYSNTKYKLAEDQRVIFEMVELIRDYTVPLLTEKCRPRGYLIVDSISILRGTQGNRDRLSVHKDLMMTLASATPPTDPFDDTKYLKVKDMTEKEKKTHGYDIAFADMFVHISREFRSQLERFSAISTELGANYDTKMNKPELDMFVYGDVYPEDYGFFRLKADNYSSVDIISKENDVYDYASRIYFKSDAEIRAEIAGHSVMIQKYEVLLDILKTCGFEHWIHK